MFCNIKSQLNEVLEINQVDANINEDDNEDNVIYTKIESHLIGCLYVICHGIKNIHDPKVNNVIILMMYDDDINCSDDINLKNNIFFLLIDISLVIYGV